MLETLLVAFCLFHSASALHVNLHHRLLVPSDGAKPSAFTYKGTVEIDTSILTSIQASYKPGSSYEHDIANFLRVAHNDDQSSSSSALYQVALELPDVNQNSWPFTSVNVCHWRATSGERIWLHTSPTGSPHSLSYWLLDSPNDGTCPPVTQKAAVNTANWNTTVIVKTPTSPPSLSLRLPPTLSPEGTPVEPEPEKSFIQKYWMYLIGGFLVMSLILPAPEESAQGQQGGDGK